MAVARELTKVHEEIIRGTLTGVATQLAEIEVRGEVTICIAAGTARVGDPEALDRDVLAARFEELLASGTARNDALKELAREHGVPRRAVYGVLFTDQQSERGAAQAARSPKTKDSTETP